MKKILFLFSLLLAIAQGGFSQETISQPTAINTWNYVYDYDVEFPFNKNIILQYDERGNLSFYYHIINYPTPYKYYMWFTHDALNRLTFEQTYFEGGSDFYGRKYYYSYDEFSNLTECLVEKRDKYYDAYFTDGYVIASKDVYQYENGKKVRWDHFVDSTLTLQNYYLYDYSDNNDWSSETQYEGNGQPVTKTEHTYSDVQEVLTDTKSNWSTESEAWVYSSHIEYTYSGAHELLSRATYNWSSETGSWLHSTLTEFDYDGGILMEKRITNWNDEEVVQQRQLYDYDEKGNCTLILFQTMVDSVYADRNRAIYIYDENNLCTNAYAQRWNDTTWVMGGFPYQTYLFFDDIYSTINDVVGSISNCTRAEVTDYVTTPNPQYILTPPDLENGEWYYEIQNGDGSITYQYLQCVGDTAVNGERPKIIVRTNQIYDKDGQAVVTHEYVYEDGGIVYWWNKELEEFTILYDLSAEEGDEWEIKVGTESLVVHVDSVKYSEMKGVKYRTLCVSDAGGLFTGDIVCGLGHTTSFFPEKLMNREANFEVDGLRCYWVNDVLVYHNGDEDCDAIHSIINTLDETNADGFRVYPNPTNGLLHVVIVVETFHETSLPSENHLPSEYRITNLMGQTLLSGALLSGTSSQTIPIDVSSLPAGMYFITCGDQTAKFIKR